MRKEEKENAIKLRKEQGLSINEIALKLGVAKGSVSAWVRNIELTEKQKAHLLSLNPVLNNQRKGAKVNKEKGLISRQIYQNSGREMAKNKNLLHAMGCMLYWGEGGKTSKWDLQISNSNPHLLKLFIKFLRECYNIDSEKMSIHIHCYLGPIKIIDIEKYWLNQLNIPQSCLRKTVVNNISKSSKLKRGRTIPYGTCQLSVHDVKVVQSIYGAIQEYGTFLEPQWI